MSTKGLIKILMEEFTAAGDVAAARLISGGNLKATGLCGWSAFHFAINGSNYKCFDLLLPHADINLPTEDHSLTPLHLAVKVQSEYMVSRLLEAEADPQVMTDNGQTALELAQLNSQIAALLRPKLNRRS